MKFRIWTEAYTPFIMGGDVNAPISTEIEVGDPVDVGRGVQVYLIASPDGETHVAESITGALVGTSIKKVKEDVAEGDIEIMKQQIEAAKERVKEARLFSNEEFWSMFR